MFDKYLFPEIEPYNTGFLKVSDIHTLYYEEVGNPNGYPVVYLHGGPGAGVSPGMRRFFDPGFYRVVLFDQRGCGRSAPFLEMRENTTWDLVDDIERLREHLGIGKWLAYGGSWGSALSLFYGETYPERVAGMIVRGVFLGRSSEITPFESSSAAAKIFPEEFERFVNFIPEDERGDLMMAYYTRIMSADEDIRNCAAISYMTWECSCCTLLPEKIEFDLERDKYVISESVLEFHYFLNNMFCENGNHILDNIDKIKDIPTTIVQGRYDVLCPPASAYDLHKAMPKSKLVIVPDASHLTWEPGIQRELVKALEEFKAILRY